MGDTYTFNYRCRLCGVVFQPMRAVEEEAGKLLAMMVDDQPISLTSSMRLGPLMLHSCEGVNVAGRLGIADILGISKCSE